VIAERFADGEWDCTMQVDLYGPFP